MTMDGCASERTLIRPTSPQYDVVVEKSDVVREAIEVGR